MYIDLCIHAYINHLPALPQSSALLLLRFMHLYTYDVHTYKHMYIDLYIYKCIHVYIYK